MFRVRSASAHWSTVQVQSQLDDIRQRHGDQSVNWRGGKSQQVFASNANRPSPDEHSLSYVENASDVSSSLANDQPMLPIYAMLALTIVVFALFVNWFFKLRCGERVINRNRRKV